MKHNKKIFDQAGFYAIQKRIIDINNFSLSEQKKILSDLEYLPRVDSRYWAFELMLALFLIVINITFYFAYNYDSNVVQTEEKMSMLIGLMIASLVFVIFLLRDTYRYCVYCRDYKSTYTGTVNHVKETIKSNELLLATFLSIRGEALRNQLRTILEREETADFIVETLLNKIYKLPEKSD